MFITRKKLDKIVDQKTEEEFMRFFTKCEIYLDNEEKNKYNKPCVVTGSYFFNRRFLEVKFINLIRKIIGRYEIK